MRDRDSGAPAQGQQLEQTDVRPSGTEDRLADIRRRPATEIAMLRHRGDQYSGHGTAEGSDAGLLELVLGGEMLEARGIVPDETGRLRVVEQRAWVEPEPARHAEAQLSARRWRIGRFIAPPTRP